MHLPSQSPALPRAAHAAADRRRWPSLAALLVALSGCFEDPDALMIGPDVGVDIGTWDGTIDAGCSAGEDGCPCTLDDQCQSAYCDIPTGADAGVCGQPCGGPCPTGKACKSVGEGGKKKFACLDIPVIPGCEPADERCDGVDNDCDGDTDEVDCGDSNPCTFDKCDPALASDLADGCTHTALAIDCDDGNPCTQNDKCQGGVCSSGPAKVCDDGNPCTLDGCDLAGACTATAADGAPCDDATACTINDTCGGGLCLGVAPGCDDNNPCTTDGCDDSTGCKHAPAALACDDGNACTVGDTCQNSACAPGVALVCDDNNPCTADACDPAVAVDGASGCTATAISALCDDNDACTTGDACIAGACAPGTATDCDDGNSCTKDSCGSDTGDCIHLPQSATLACDDGNPCTSDDVCDHKANCIGSAKNCDDGVGCTLDFCDSILGSCYHENNSGFACEDGNLCTLGDACIAGGCVGGKSKLCDDAKPCTSDSCNDKTGDCIFSPNTLACDDGNPCTQVDQCGGGTCNGSKPVVCDDGNVCTLETCDTATGKCDSKFAADNVICSDGSACTDGDFCTKGSCGAGPGKYCNDDNPCTNDACDPATGACIATANTLPCDDGNTCTKGDACTAGACKGGANSCECQSTAECKPKEDGDLCNGTLVCNLQTHTCEVDDNTKVVCDPANDTACVKQSCQATTGVCTPNVKGDGTSCEADDSVCTIGDACVAGQCIAGKLQVCKDDNPCTDETCDSKQGCVYPANSLPCFDGDACTKGDVCKDGACKDGGTLKSCNDNDVCSADSCNPKTGNCVFAPLSGGDCDDGNACTSADVCQSGGCLGGKTKSCDDNNVCTLDTCDGQTGLCSSTPAFEGNGCDDGKACTKGDTCTKGVCKSGPVPNCDDSDPCTAGSCDPSTGGCVQKPAGEGLPCSDGNACTLKDVCKAGACVAADAKLCDDSNICTIDTCSASSGLCVYEPTAEGLPCDDGKLCTLGDACDKGACKPNGVPNCDDNNVCTDDSCDDATGKCIHPPVPPLPVVQCNDGNACTWDTTVYKLYQKVGDACWSGICTGTPVSCNDGNVCTVDSCDPKSGCKHQQLGDVACNDGNACTTGDTCKTGTCKGAGLQCNDGNYCTNDSCNTKTGCVFANNTIGCNDGNICTTSDQCGGGKCSGKGALDCNDGVECTDDPCDPKKGCQHVLDASNLCSDGDACTAGDKCNGDACVGAGPTDCDDKSVCTKDSCDPKKGCQYSTAGELPCDDGNACTIVDVCANGKCTTSGQLDCNDKDVCTTDSCDPKKGCQHVHSNGPCDDGDACTTGDACVAGACKAKGSVTCNDGSICTKDACDPAMGCTFEPAPGQSKVQVILGSNVATQSATVFVGNEPKDLQAAQVVLAKPSSWVSVPDAYWVAAPSCAEHSPDGKSVTFRRELDLPSAAQVTGAALSVAGAGAYTCSIGGQVVAKGNGAGTFQSVDATAPLKAGATDLVCVLVADGKPTSPTGNAPCGIAFRLAIDLDVAALTCDDGSACTSLDICDKGACVGTNGLSCNDGNPCTKDVCDPKAGCAYSADNGVACSDGDACSGPDFCKDGGCTATAKTDCSDNNDCTADGCDAILGCSHVAVTPGAPKALVVVSDAKAQCAKTFQVISGVEVPTGLQPCEATYAGNPAWTKLSGSTWIWSSAIVADPTKDETVYVAWSIDVPKGVEQLQGTLHLAADADALCRIGADVVAALPASQQPWTKVVSAPIGTWIKAGTNQIICKVKNIGDPTGTILTNPAGLLFRTELSWYEPGAAKPCSDGNACTKDDGCQSGQCVPGPVLSCDDSNPCTVEVCDSKTGCQVTADDTAPCNDGSVCTEGDACKGGACVSAKTKSCNDGNACTLDVCDAKTGCGGAPVSGNPGCDDNSVCTATSFCQGGACVAGEAKDCSDGKPCTLDSCDAKAGCTYKPTGEGQPCDDNDTCTADDICKNGLCLGKQTAPCDDGNPCTKDLCSVQNGCEHVATTGGICDDGDACTQGDLCVAGACKAGAASDCFDTEQCTLDVCDPKTGKCSFEAISDAECDDGNLCSLNDSCDQGVCKAGPPPPCSDNDPCTVDNCDPLSGKCQHDTATPGSACDDGNLCTPESKCASGKCVGATKTCDDASACTVDSCNAATGKCAFTPIPDGKACGNGGTCQSGVCLGG